MLHLNFCIGDEGPVLKKKLQKEFLKVKPPKADDDDDSDDDGRNVKAIMLRLSPELPHLNNIAYVITFACRRSSSVSKTNFRDFLF